MRQRGIEDAAASETWLRRTPDEDPKPVEEAGEDREREARGGDA
jgi:hypothetical protein